MFKSGLMTLAVYKTNGKWNPLNINFVMGFKDQKPDLYW